MDSNFQGGVNLAGGALGLAGAFDPDADAKRRAFAAAQAAAAGSKGAGALAGAPSLSQVGQGISTGIGLAGTGYNLYNTLSDDNLSQSQKVGHTGRSIADTIMSLVIPYYGLAKGVQVAGHALEGSGSPQVRGLGRSLDYVAEPAGAKAFWDVAQGDMSPKAAFKKEGGLEGLTLDMMGPAGIIMRGLGAHLPFLHHEPTTGTKFRDELGHVLPQVGVKGANMGLYNAPAGGYGAFDPKAVQAAQQVAGRLTPFAKDSRHNMPAYNLQTENILLNNYGNDLPTMAAKIMAQFNKK